MALGAGSEIVVFFLLLFGFAMAVFISYNYLDNDFAQQLSIAIIGENIKVWKDSWRIGVGDSLVGKIGNGLEGSEFLCVLLSRNSIESAWVKKELSVTLIREIEDRDITILAVVLDDVEIPLLLRDKVCADLRDGFHSVVRNVLARMIPTYHGPSSLFDKAFHYKSVLYRMENETPILDIQIVSFDLDEAYSVLTQICFTGTERGKAMVAGMSKEKVAQMIVRNCSESFGYGAKRVVVSPKSIHRTNFTLCDSEDETLFHAGIKCMIIGEMKRGALVFNAAALFSQLGD